MKNGRVLPLNCLTDADGHALKDDNGQKIPARVIYNDGNFTVALTGSVLTTKDMDKNLKEALRYPFARFGTFRAEDGFESAGRTLSCRC